MQQTKQISIPIYAGLRNEPTCRAPEGVCLFYRTGKFGQAEYCSYTNKNIERGLNTAGVPNLGYTIPTEGCPLHDTMNGKEVL